MLYVHDHLLFGRNKFIPINKDRKHIGGITFVSNFVRFEVDLERLISEAGKLELSFLIQVHGEADIAKQLKLEEENALKNLPSFNVAYEAWYSECLAFVKQILPDRLQDFKDHFESPKNRKEITYANYRIQDALKVPTGN